MGLDDFLKSMKPELNENGFDVLKGTYRVVIKNEPKAETGFLITKFPSGDEARRFQVTCDVVDVLSGNGTAGRRVWLRYNEDENGVKKLINDLFTAGLLDKIDRTSIDQLKATLPDIGGSVAFLKAWGWTPEKNRAGESIPEGERKTMQQGNLVDEKTANKVGKKKDENPF